MAKNSYVALADVLSIPKPINMGGDDFDRKKRDVYDDLMVSIPGCKFVKTFPASFVGHVEPGDERALKVHLIRSGELLEKAFESLVKELEVQKELCVILCGKETPEHVTKGGVLGEYKPVLNAIEINALQSNGDLYFEESLVTTLAHEMVHAEQHNFGKLKAGGCGYELWDGKLYEIPKNLSKEVYENFPWEKEAFARAPALAERAMRHVMTKLGKTVTLGG